MVSYYENRGIGNTKPHTITKKGSDTYASISTGKTLYHQTIARELFTSIDSYIKSNDGSCEPFFAPFAVFLNEDNTNYVEPDICVVCDHNKLTDKGCSGAPDWIIEIVSPSNRPVDYYTKLVLRNTGS